MGIEVSDKEIADELKKLKKENFKNEAEYEKFLKTSHYSPADIDRRVKVQIIGTEIQNEINESAPKPTQSEIENYYAAAKDTPFTQKASRDIRVIVNKDKAKVEAAREALEKDRSPDSWKEAAKKYSEDPVTKGKGGLQAGITEGAAEEPLNEAFFETPERELSGVVKTPQAYYVFEVENSTPERVQELEDVETQIKTQLEQTLQQDAFGVFISNYSNKWRSRTFCADDYVMERCANYTPNAHPSTAPPGCYEEDPKDGLPDACPAPVFQLVPALPGTVSPVEPRGTPLAQRPFPAGGKEAEEPAAAEGLPEAP